MTEHRRRLPLHVAVHYLACARQDGDRIATSNEAGMILERIADRVRRLTFVAYDPPEHPSGNEDTTPYEFQRDNVDVLSLGPKGTWRDRRARRQRVASIVERSSVSWDLLVLRLVNRRAPDVWRANRCPRVVTQVGGSMLEYVLGSDLPAHCKAVRLALAVWEERNQRRIIRSAALTAVVGERLRERYARDGNVEIIRESALSDADIFIADDRLNDGAPSFLFAGQVVASKGIHETLAAFARIRGELLPQARLHIVGDGPEMPNIRAWVDRSGLRDAITLHGWVTRDAMMDLYRRTDVLLCLSRVDFMPRVIWEAMGSSVPVVATRVGSVPWAFEDGRHLLLVPSAEPGIVTERVRMLVEDESLRRSIISRARERAREATLETFADRLLARSVAVWPELAGVGHGT